MIMQLSQNAVNRLAKMHIKFVQNVVCLKRCSPTTTIRPPTDPALHYTRLFLIGSDWLRERDDHIFHDPPTYENGVILLLKFKSYFKIKFKPL